MVLVRRGQQKTLQGAHVTIQERADADRAEKESGFRAFEIEMADEMGIAEVVEDLKAFELLRHLPEQARVRDLRLGLLKEVMPVAPPSSQSCASTAALTSWRRTSCAASVPLSMTRGCFEIVGLPRLLAARPVASRRTSAS